MPRLDPTSARPTSPLPLGPTGRRARRITAVLTGLALCTAPAWASDVPTVVVQSAQSARTLEIDGALQAMRQATVAAQASGSILEMKVKAGDRVKAGQALARIDSRTASAGVAEGDAAVAQAQARLGQAQINVRRNQDLSKAGFISPSVLDQAQNELKAAQAAVAQAQAARRQASLAQGFTSVTAPFDAVVLSTQAESGDLAAPGRAIATVYAPGALRAVVQVPSSQAAVAKSSPNIEVQLPDQRWIAPVKRTDLPTADPVSQTVEWRLDLSAADSAAWMPGQNVRVRFAGGQGQSQAAGAAAGGATALVPASAVVRRGELTAVYVARDDHFALRAVRTGSHQGDRIEVLTGLKGGERIAVDGVKAGLDQARPGR